MEMQYVQSIQISGFNLKAGSILSVFKPKKRSLRTVHADIGVRGTGLYLECDSDKSYICTCYGTVDISILKMPEVTETVTTQHHDEPRYIYSGKEKNSEKITYIDKNYSLPHPTGDWSKTRCPFMLAIETTASKATYHFQASDGTFSSHFSATKNYFWRGQSKTRVQPFGKNSL